MTWPSMRWNMLELNPYLAVSHCGLGDSLAYVGRSQLDRRGACRAWCRVSKARPADPVAPTAAAHPVTAGGQAGRIPVSF
jgi:hypothetical protein